MFKETAPVFVCKTFKKYALSALFIILLSLNSFAQVNANPITYFEDFNSQGYPTNIPAGGYWSFINEIHPSQDTWNEFIPGDGNAYITVDSDTTNDTDWIHPFQTLTFGGVGENHRLEVRMKGAVVDGGLVSFLFTYRQEGSIFNEVDLELVANDDATPSHNTLPSNGGWTDARFNTWRNADENTNTPFTGTKKGIVNQANEKISLIDDQFHTYTIDWVTDRLDFFIDGVLQESITTNVATGVSEVIIGFRDLPWAGNFNWSGTHTVVVDYLKIEPIVPTTVAENDSFTVNIDTVSDLDVLGNDVIGATILSCDPISVQGYPVYGTPSLITYTPSGEFEGQDSFTYTIDDGNGVQSTATVSLTVGEINPFPTAKQDATTVNASQMSVINVLANNGNGTDRFGTDGPINGGLTMPNGTLSSASIKGSLISIDNKGTLNTLDDVFNYTPSALAETDGTDSFSYVITDATGDASTGVVSVTISSDPVLGYTPDSITVNQDSSDNEIDVMANDADDAGFVGNEVRFLIESLDNLTGTTANGGTVTLNTKGNANTADDVINYTPLTGFVGVDTFNYIPGNDLNALVLVTVTVQQIGAVSETLTAVDDTISVAKNSSDTPIDVTDNDDYGSNGESATHPLTLTNGKFSTASNNGGAIIILGGKVNYSAPTGFTGIDSFEYTITDGNGKADTAIVTVTVGATATEAENDSFTINLDTATDLDILANDVAGATILSYDALSTEGYTVSGTSSLITYTPSGGFIGADSFTYTIDDGNGVQSTATVFLTVGETNAFPTANPDVIAVNTAQMSVIDVLANNGSGADSFGTDGAINGGLTMPNGTLSSASIKGSLISIDNQGTLDTLDDVFNYTPSALAETDGTDSFSYVITDATGDASTGVVSVTISSGPVLGFAPDSITVDQDSSDNEIDVMANDNDDAGFVGHEIRFLIESLDNLTGTTANGGIVTLNTKGNANTADDVINYTPLAGFVGVDTFNYIPGNDLNALVLVTVTVQQIGAVSGALTAVNDTIVVATNSSDTPIDVTDNDDYGSNGESATHPLTLTNGKFSTASNNGGPISVVNGKINYSAPTGFTGIDSFEYTITDANGFADTAIVTVTVGAAATVAENDSFTVSINTATDLDVLANDVTGATILSYDALSTEGFTVSGTPSLITYTPSGGFIGSDSFTYTIDDGNGVQSTATVNLTVGETNPFPTAKADVIAVNTAQMTIIDVLANNGNGADSFGIDGAINGGLTMLNGTLSSASLKGSAISIDNQGTLNTLDDVFNYTPSALAETDGTDSFSYVITDASGDASTGIVTVTINNASGANNVSSKEGNSTSEASIENKFSAYPNPSNGYVKSTLFSTIDTKATLALFDVAGKVVYSAEIKVERGNNEFELNLNLKPGIVFMRVISSEVNFGTTKIIFK